MNLLDKAAEYSKVGRTRQAINACIENVRVFHARIKKKVDSWDPRFKELDQRTKELEKKVEKLEKAGEK